MLSRRKGFIGPQTAQLKVKKEITCNLVSWEQYILAVVRSRGRLYKGNSQINIITVKPTQIFVMTTVAAIFNDPRSANKGRSHNADRGTCAGAAGGPMLGTHRPNTDIPLIPPFFNFT